MKRDASTRWQGDLRTGKGRISSQSGVLKANCPVSRVLKAGISPEAVLEA